MKKQVFGLSCVCAMLVLGAGCLAPSTAGQQSTIVVEGDRVISASLKTDSPWAARHVALSGATTALLPNGLLQVQAHLTSTDKRDYALQYKFYWYDVRGMEIKADAERPWQQATIHGGEGFRANGVAPSDSVATVVIAVRPLR